MVKRCSIAEAQSRLSGLVREAEGGARVELTREGRLVAMILGVSSDCPDGERDFWAAYQEYRRTHDLSREETPADEEAPVIGSSLDHLIGCWSAQDEQEFLKAIEVFEQVDESLG